jgi:hypothetical protein
MLTYSLSQSVEHSVWQPEPRGNPSQKHDDGGRPEARAKYLREDERKDGGRPAGGHPLVVLPRRRASCLSWQDSPR